MFLRTKANCAFSLTCQSKKPALVFQQSHWYNRRMSPLIVTIIIALATFIISIFGARWLNQQAMNKRIDDLRSYLDARFATQDTRFAAIEQPLDRIERQLEAIFKPPLPSR